MNAVDWEWGRSQAVDVLYSAKLRPNLWIKGANTPANDSWDIIWETSIYPLRYFLNLEDNVTTKVEVIGDRKVLFVKYEPPTPPQTRLKKFIAAIFKN